MSNYENAPATKILATHCAVCGRPLLDALSVETGIGPDCRKRYLVTKGLSDEARQEANQMVFWIAASVSAVRGGDLEQTARASVAGQLARLRELGFEKLADKLETAWVQIKVFVTEGRLAVKMPYSDQSVAMCRRIYGRRWDPKAKLNTFPNTDESRRHIWLMLRRCYPGFAALGPKGAFVVEPMNSRWDDDGLGKGKMATTPELDDEYVGESDQEPRMTVSIGSGWRAC